MVNNDQQILPFDQIKSEIFALCESNQSGDFWIFTEDKHTAIISIHEGEIVGLRYRISRGVDALDKILSIKKASIKFQVTDSNADKAGKTTLPTTVEIFKTLGIELDDSKSKVMVVEDSPTQRKVICNMLIQEGYQVIEACDGYQALTLLDMEKPGLILLDIIMPGMDGYEVMSAIKKRKDMGNVKVIMLTARGSLIDKVYGKVAGTDEYLTKPFKSEELMEKIGKYLKTNKYTRANNASSCQNNVLQKAHA